MDTAMDSIEAKIAQLQNSLQSLWQNTISSNFVKLFIDLANAIMKAVNSAGALKTILGSFAAIKGLKVLNNKFSLFGNLKDQFKQINKLKSAYKTLQNTTSFSKHVDDSKLMTNKSEIDAYAASVEGLNKRQAKLILTQQGLSEAQIEQVFANQSLVASGQAVSADTIRQAVSESALTEAKQQDILATFQQQMANGVLTKEKLIELSLREDEIGAIAANILAKMGEAGATNTLTASIKANTMAMITWMATNPIGWIMAIGAAIGIVTSIISNQKQKAEEAAQAIKEAYEEAKSSIEDTRRSLKDQSSLVEDSAETYAKLAQGVNTLNNTNLRLSDDDYKEFLNITNELAESFPQLTTGYDDNGNAIINLNGSVETITSSLGNLLEVEQSLARQKIVDNMSDYMVGSAGELDDLESKLEDIKSKSAEYSEIYSKISSGESLSYMEGTFTGKGYDEKELINFLNEIGIEKQAALGDVITNGNGGQDWYNVYDFSEDELKKLSNAYQTYLMNLESSTNNAKTELSNKNMEIFSNLSYWLQDTYTYKNQDNNLLQQVIQDQVKNINWQDIELNEDDPWTSMRDYIQENVLSAFDGLSDGEISLISSIYTVPDDIKSDVQKYVDYINSVQTKLDEAGVKIDVTGVVSDEQDLVDKFNSNNNRLVQGTYDIDFSKGEHAQEILDQYFKEHNITTKEDIELWNKYTSGAKNAYDAIIDYEDGLVIEAKNAEAARIENAKLYNVLGKTEKIDDFQSSIESLSESITLLMSNDYSTSDLLDSLQKVKGVADEISSTTFKEIFGDVSDVSEFEAGIYELADEYVDNLISDLEINPNSDFAKMLHNIVVESVAVEARLEGITTNIDNLQGAYDSLKTAIKEYNENGFLTMDTMQSILTLSPQYMECLVDETGKLQLNEEAYKNLAQMQINEAKASVTAEYAAQLQSIAMNDLGTATEDSGKKTDTFIEKIKNWIQNSTLLGGVLSGLSTAIFGVKAAADDNTSVDDLDSLYDEASAKNAKAAEQAKAAWLAKLSVIDKTVAGWGNNFDDSFSNVSDSASNTVFDWIERRIAKVQKTAERAIDKVKDTLSTALTGSRVSNAFSKLNDEFKANATGYAKYMAKANGISGISAYKSRIQNGSFSITELGDKKGDLADKIQQYQDWYDKAQDCKDAMYELRDSVESLAETLTQTPIDRASEAVDKYTSKSDLISGKIDSIVGIGKRTTYYNKQNEYISSSMSSYNTAVSGETSIRNTYGKKISNYSYKNQSSKDNAKWKAAVKAAKDNIAKHTKISDTNIEYIYAYCNSLGSMSLYQSCITYNKSVDALYDAEVTAEAYAVSSQNDKKANWDAIRDYSISSRKNNVAASTGSYNWTSTSKNSALSASNSEMKTSINAYATETASAKSNMNSAKKSGYNSVNSAYNSTKNKAYKAALLKAKTAMNSGKKIDGTTLNTIKSNNSVIYNKCLSYNTAVEEYITAQYEQSLNFASASAQIYQNRQSMTDNNIAEQDRQDTLASAKEAIASTASSKNYYVDKKITNIGDRLDSYKTAATNANTYLTDAKKSFNGNSTTLVNKALSSTASSLGSYKTYVQEAVNTAKKGTSAISENTLSRILQGVQAGVVTETFYQACVSYNDAFEYKKQADAAYELYQQTSIQEKSALNIEKLENKSTERHKDNVDKSRSLSGLNNLINDDMLFDADGNATEYYTLKVGTTLSQLANSQNDLADYKTDINELNTAYKAGGITTDDYNTRLASLQQSYLDSASSVKQYKDQLIDLYKNAEQNELDRINELIDARTKALQKKKDYYDYDKSIKDKNKNIEAIQNEIAALEGVETAEANAQKARLEADLYDAQEELDDAVNEHIYSIQVDGLNDLKDDLADLYDQNIKNFQTSLDAQEALIKQQQQLVSTSADIVSSALSTIAKTYGLDVNLSGIKQAISVTPNGAATGGIINKSGIVEDGIMQLTAGETILTDKFTEVLPASVAAMNMFNENMNKLLHPDVKVPTSAMMSHSNVTIHYDNLINVNGSVDATVVSDIKKLSTDIVNQTISTISKDMRRSGIQFKI